MASTPHGAQRATFGFSRGGFYFKSGTTVDLPSWVNAGQPVGAVVVGGGTTLNGRRSQTEARTPEAISALRAIFYTPQGWRSSEGAFYAEDAVKLKPSLELRIGFRGEFTNGWNEVDGLASNYVYNSAGVIVSPPVVGSSALAINNAKFLPAPRLGLAWAPFASKKKVIRAGVGVYYALLDNLSYRLDQNPPYNTVYAVKNIPFSSIAPVASRR